MRPGLAGLLKVDAVFDAVLARASFNAFKLPEKRELDGIVDAPEMGRSCREDGTEGEL